MNLTPWKKHEATLPSSPLSSFQHEMNRMFSRFFDGIPTLEDLTVFPPVAISENTKTITVTAEIPGIAANELEINVNDDVLTLRGEKKAEKDNWYRVERSFGSFIRRIQLPSAVDTAHAEATLEKGVLTLKLTKSASDKATTIKVQAK